MGMFMDGKPAVAFQILAGNFKLARSKCELLDQGC
jgi:hypothetical protein